MAKKTKDAVVEQTGAPVEESLEQSSNILQLFENMQTVNMGHTVDEIMDLGYPEGERLKNTDMCFYKVERLSYDEDYPRREAFENVLLSLDNEAFNFVYILSGTEAGVELDIGVVKNHKNNKVVLGKKLSAVNYGENIANVFEGNFSGSSLKKILGNELEKLVGQGIRDVYKNAGIIVGIPSVNENDTGEKYDFQGMDRLINSMLGENWRLVIVCEPVGKGEILEIQNDIFELYNRLSVSAKRTMQQTVNDGSTLSFGTNISESKGKNWGYNKSDAKSSGEQGETWNKSKQHQEGSSEGESRDRSKGSNKSYSMNRGTSRSVTVEMANKHAEELMNYINDELLERLKSGFSKGLFKTSIYYMAEKPVYANRLKVGIISLFQGDRSSYSPLYAQSIDLSKEKNLDALRMYQNQYAWDGNSTQEALLLLGRPFFQNRIGLNTYLTTEEISLIAGLPQKEVPGISLTEGVGFGLNQREVQTEESICLGNMVQKGRELQQVPFLLAKKSLAKHTFIAGVTGSGKTTTCHRLLSEAGMPFLVIEPAKTEYRTLIDSYKDLVVFTLGNETIAPFRINPFELIEGEVISAHVDMVKATFTSAFPMEASMPQILEESIYRCYEKKGWDIDTNTNEKYGDKAFDQRVDSFPILSDLLEEMKKVVVEKNFSAQMQADYIGSLVSRLSNLTVGSKGSMLNCAHSTDFGFIAHHKVVLEMEELRSPEDKALLMGFVLARLSAVIKEEHKKNHGYKHITLVEEAHRLLSKVEYGDSGSKKTAVETFTDLLAEVRKYGEGLIIVDQIPNKLSPEVLKNTNTKIIHKILARDDKEAVGDTMLMDDKQKEYLSALHVGHAVVFSENTDKPVHIHVTAVSNTNEEQVEDNKVIERFQSERGRGYLGGCYDKLEIMKIYELYDRVASEFTKLDIDKEKCSQLKRAVKDTAERMKCNQEMVWEVLIRQRDKLSGKASGSSDDGEERIRNLKDFFTDVFCKESFCENDIDKNGIEIYLM